MPLEQLCVKSYNIPERMSLLFERHKINSSFIKTTYTSLIHTKRCDLIGQFQILSSGS